MRRKEKKLLMNNEESEKEIQERGRGEMLKLSSKLHLLGTVIFIQSLRGFLNFRELHTKTWLRNP